jgi:hypothetical protein
LFCLVLLSLASLRVLFRIFFVSFCLVSHLFCEAKKGHPNQGRVWMV